MKQTILSIALLLFVGIGIASAQVPRTLNLQSIVYDVDGHITTSESVDLTVRILDGSGNVLYSEDFTAVPVVKGAITIEIGEASGGIPLSALDPSTGDKLLDVTVDNESPFDLIPFSSVPYAIYAEKALSVPEDSIESQHIKDGTIKVEDLEPALQFSDLQGQLAETQAPQTFTMDTELQAHLSASPAHKARDISLSGIFVNFYADDVAEAITKLDSKLVDEIVNRQAAVAGSNATIGTLQTVTSDINNIPGTLGEGKIDGVIARDSEYQAGDTALQTQVSSNDTDITNLQNITSNINNLPGTLGEGKIDATIARDAELTFGNLSGTIADNQIPASIARDIEIPSVITDHGALSGLGDDDHTQYLLSSGARALSGNLNMGGNSVTNVGNVDGVDVSGLNTRVTDNEGDIAGHETRITALEEVPQGNQVAVDAGYLTHGQTIPLPGGYTAGQCAWTAAWATSGCLNVPIGGTIASVNTSRVITCQCREADMSLRSSTCSYTIMCAK